MQQTDKRDNEGRLERFEDLNVWQRAHKIGRMLHALIRVTVNRT